LELSVIIVNYNVKHFLEQCLRSVLKTCGLNHMEVIVVDNHSTDDSLACLQPKFPEVRFIRNDSNTGFAKACNKGLQLATGRYVLFLNPDTIIAEDSLRKCIGFFGSHPDCGALGVQMIDGSGRFLKESKRSFPSPLTSLYKLFGLSVLFPRSKVFGQYHLGNLDKSQDHEVDVLAGAFMMIPRKVLDELGSFDETFFMYGEDVDLSYRIQKAGYRNYYFAGTTIIHFKGESTKKGSLNYVRMFYNAMSLFVHKHYGGTRAGIFNLSIQFAIRVRAAIAAMTKFLKWIGLPLLDAALILLCFWLVKEVWEGYVKTGTVYSNKLLLFSFPAFTAVYLIVAYYGGLYDRYYRAANLIRSTSIATIVLLAAYSLLPESLRFSRGIVFFGALLAFLLITMVRMVLIRARVLYEPIDKISKHYIMVAGSPAELEQVKSFLKGKNIQDKIIGRIAIRENEDHFVGRLDDMAGAIKVPNAQEIIFCAGTISYKTIIEKLKELNGKLKARFFAGTSVIGSDDKTTRGEILSAEVEFRLAKPNNRRLKRLIDVVVALAALLLFPLHFLFVKKPVSVLKNCFLVLAAKRTWVGYILSPLHLPKIRKGILRPDGHPSPTNLPEENLKMIDYWYARNYEPLQDLALIFKNYRYLGS
jgi:GT2 family glycosyltransferase